MNVYEKYNLNIEQLKPELIDSFVAIYGEKHRETITKRINSIYICSYVTAEDLKEFTNELLTNNKTDLRDELLEHFNLSNNSNKDDSSSIFDSMYLELLSQQMSPGKEPSNKSENLLNICFSSTSYSLERQPDILQLFSEEYFSNNPNFQQNIIKQRVNILNFFGANVTSENYQIAMENGSLDEILKSVQELQQKIQELDNKHLQFLEKYNDELEEIKKNENTETELSEKYTSEFMEELLSYLPPDIQDKFQNSHFSMESNLYSIGYPKSFLDQSPIEYFSSEANQELIDNPNSKQSQNIIAKRIYFFKLQGFDFGDDYSKYINNSQIQNIIPDSAYVDKIIQLKQTYETKFKIDVIKQTGSYSRDIEQLSKLQLLENYYGIDLINSKKICLEPNSTHNGENIISQPVLFIPIFDLLNKNGNWFKCADIAIIHEIGHAIEEELIQSENGDYIHKTGLEFFETDFIKDSSQEESLEENSEKREFETSNEAIHQNLSILVANHLHSKGIFIIDYPEESETRGSMPSYEFAFELIEPLFNQFRVELTDAMMSSQSFEKFKSSDIYPIFLKINSYCQALGKMSIYDINLLRINLHTQNMTPEVIRYLEMKQSASTLIKQQKLLSSVISKSTSLSLSEISQAQSNLEKDIQTQSITQTTKQSPQSKTTEKSYEED